MSTPILATKFYIPQPRSELVSRPRLLRRLNDGLAAQRRLTLVSAPAGFGKTTLVSSWIDALRVEATKENQTANRNSTIENRVAWLALEENDNDLGRFLTYLVAALQKNEPELGRPVRSALQAAQLPPIESLLTALINEIAVLDRPLLLVLDDYHVVEIDEIHDALTFLLEHLPRQMHIVLTTRVDPPLPLSRWRVRGQITELRAADLRFTIEEMVTFLNERMELSLAPDDIRVLEERTEGWIAGLQLAALSMRRAQDVPTFIKSFAGSHHYVVEYLVDEVLNQQPEAIKQFLLKTSILERLSWPLCAVLVGEKEIRNEEIGNETSEVSPIDPLQASLSDTESPLSTLHSPISSSQEILNYLLHANLFIIPLDSEWRWFRYHQLFAQVLQNRLQHTLAPQEVVALKLRASRWCAQNGYISEAIRYALAADEVDQAAELIETHARPLMMRGQIATIRHWLSSLSADQIASRPRLGLLDASLRIVSSDYDTLATRIDEIEQALNRQRSTLSKEQYRELQAELLAYDAILLVTQNKSAESVAQIQQALNDVAEENFYLRGIIALILSGALFNNGQEEAAVPVLRRSIELSEMAGNIFWTLLGIARLAQFQNLRGELRAAEMLYREALQLAGQQNDKQSPGVSFAYDGLGEIYWEWNQLEKAVEHLELAIKLSDVGGIKVGSMLNRMHLAFVLHHRAKLERADQLLAEAEAIAEEITHPYARHALNVLKIRLLLSRNRLDKALDLVTVLNEKLDRDDPLIIVETTWAVMARVYIAQVRRQPNEETLDKALDLLADLCRQAESVGRRSYLIEALVLQAMAYQVKGSIDRAVSALIRAIELGQPEGYTRVFVNEGRPMADLLGKLLAKDSTHETCVRKLLEIITAEEAQSQESSSAAPEPVASSTLIEPLSERELEVLRLVATGSSNRQIAKSLIIAQGTVKKHLSNIFGKLNAESRTQAVARAREVGLLE